MDLLSSLGIAPVQAEDVVFVAIYPDDPKQDLQALRVECMQLLLPLLKGYIWQKDPLHLHTSDRDTPPWASHKSGRVRAKHSSNKDAPPASPPCLWAALRFGDNIEDEWFVVFVVKTLTEQLSVDSSARVWDNDGEFLLIEAAYALPKWLKPETSENRLWWRRGQLVLIPPRGPSHPNLPSFPTVQQALSLVKEGVHAPQVQKIQKVVDKRLSDYSPSSTTNLMHRSHCMLPLKLAHVLSKEPQLVSAAVESFYYRDPASTKVARRMAHFPPHDMVPTVVCLNRCMYAQLKQQQFHPPKGFPMPPSHSPDYAAADLGLKLMFGMEVVYHESSKHMDKGNQAAGTEGQLESKVAANLDSNPAWRSYLARLETRGYFQGNIPGSQQHSRLLSQAREAFSSTELYDRSMERLAAPGQRIDELLQEPISADEFSQEKLAAADSDGWMAEEGLRLERELNEREAEWEAYTKKKAHKAGDAASVGPTDAASSSLDAANLVKVMHQFVEHMSGLEGVEVPKDAGGVNLNSSSLWDELCNALGATTLGGQPPAGSRGAAVDEDEDDAFSSGSYTTTEGSSFFEGSDASEDDEDGEEESEGDSDVSSESDQETTHSSDADSDIKSQNVSKNVSRRDRFRVRSQTPAGTGRDVKTGAHAGENVQAVRVGGETFGSELQSGSGEKVEKSSRKHGTVAQKTLNHPQVSEGHHSIDPEKQEHGGFVMEADDRPRNTTTMSPASVLPVLSSSHEGTTSSEGLSTSGSGQDKVVAGMGPGLRAKMEMENQINGDGVGVSLGVEDQITVEDDDWGVQTGTDSDDYMEDREGEQWAVSDTGDDFMDAYDEALRSELAGTTMAQSFETARGESSTVNASTSSQPAGESVDVAQAQQHRQGMAATGVRGLNGESGTEGEVRERGEPGGSIGGEGGVRSVREEERELKPVDVDMNLVKSLLRSHAEQHGLPGPATGLLGLLGVHLPRTTEREDE